MVENKLLQKWFQITFPLVVPSKFGGCFLSEIAVNKALFSKNCNLFVRDGYLPQRYSFYIKKLRVNPHYSCFCRCGKLELVKIEKINTYKNRW